MAKSPRLTDTVTGAVKAMQDASRPLPECPEELSIRPEDKPFWDRIVRARARDEWEGPQIVIGIQLARCQADIEEQNRELQLEGAVVKNDRGTPIKNPRFSVLTELMNMQMALMRSMALNATAHTRAADLQKKREPEKTARQAQEQVSREDLLA